MVGMIRLTKSQAADLKVVCRIGAEKLARLRVTLEADGAGVKPALLRRKIADSLGDTAESEAVERVLFGFCAARRRRYGSVQELTSTVSKYIGDEQWEPDLVDAWAQIKPEFEKLLALNSVVLASKAKDLGYDFDRIYQTSRIITDIRPIFDDGRTEVIGTTIIQSLRLETYSAEGQQSETILLDAGDLDELRQACERAVIKAHAARTLIKDRCRIEAIVLGEDDVAS